MAKPSHVLMICLSAALLAVNISSCGSASSAPSTSGSAPSTAGSGGKGVSGGAGAAGRDSAAAGTGEGAAVAGAGEGGAPEGGAAEGGAADGGASGGGAAPVSVDHCAGAAVCDSARDCPTPSGGCVQAACLFGCCTTTNRAVLSACTDNNGTVCDGAGTCIGCFEAANCPVPISTCQVSMCDTPSHLCIVVDALHGTSCSDSGGSVCSGRGSCIAAHCADGLLDADESDVDCGGSCGPTCSFNAAQHCSSNGDCESGVCSGSPSKCQAPTCSDGVKNGHETGTDCGGTDCLALNKLCPQTQGCSGNQDCAPLTGNECAVAGCKSGTCGVVYLDATHTLSTGQTPGDCQKIVCNGNGGTKTADDVSDVPSSAPLCYVPACTGSPSAPGSAPGGKGTHCPNPYYSGGTWVCSDVGTCVECNGPTDCMALSDAGNWTCTNNQCDF